MQQPCVPCTKSELDLENVPPLQIGVVDDYLVHTGPKSGPGRALEFLIPASGDDYLDLSHCYLYLKCRVLKDDGTAIETLKTDNTVGEDGSVAPVNLLFHSFFRQFDLVMTLTTLLSYSRDAKETWFNHLEGWCTDDHGKCDAQDNTGLLNRWNKIVNSQPFDFQGRLHSDMLLQEQLLPNNMNVRLVLSRSRPAFHLMDFNGKSSYHVRIEEAVLEVRKVKMATSEQLRLEKVLMTSGAKYPLAHVVTRHFTLAAGASTADVDPLFTGQIPTKVMIGLVNNEAFVGSWTKSPFNFAHMDLNQACLVVDGRPLPAQPWQPDFKQGLYEETYHALLKSAGMYPSDWSNGLSAAQFVGGTMLLSWDLTPDDSDGMAYLSPRPLGTVKASLRFAKPLPAKTTLLAYAQYDNLVFHSLFRQFDLVMNDALVATSGDTYPYRAYLTTLLSYGRDAKETWLNRLEGWCTDEHGKCDAQDNTGLLNRRNKIVNSQPFEFKGRMHSDML